MSQFCNSPIVNIEVHDRDERENSRRSVGSVFGSENTDEIIGKVSSKMNLLKPKTESNWHPHGCVKLDLSELWLGQTSFEFYIPVVPCHAPESAASNFHRVFVFHSFMHCNELHCRTRNQCQTIGSSSNSTRRFSFQWNTNANSCEIS